MARKGSFISPTHGFRSGGRRSRRGRPKKQKKKRGKKKCRKGKRGKKCRRRRRRRLFKYDAAKSSRNINECRQMSDIDSCKRIKINFMRLKSEKAITLLDDNIVYKHKYSQLHRDVTKTFSYETDDMDSVVFVVSLDESGYPKLDGSFTAGGSKYLIDNCGHKCHVLIKLGFKTLHPTKTDVVIDKPVGKLRRAKVRPK